METPDPPNDTPGALKQVVLIPHDIPWSLMYYALGPSPRAWKSDKLINIFRLVLDSLWISFLGILTGIVAGSNLIMYTYQDFRETTWTIFLRLPKTDCEYFLPRKGARPKIYLVIDWFQGKSTYMFGNSRICVAPGPENFSQPPSWFISETVKQMMQILGAFAPQSTHDIQWPFVPCSNLIFPVHTHFAQSFVLLLKKCKLSNTHRISLLRYYDDCILVIGVNY